LGSSTPLVILGGVERELTDWFSVLGDDTYVAVGDEHQHSLALVAPAQADVVQPGSVAQRDHTGLVDPVVPDAVVALGGIGRARRGLGSGGEGLSWCPASHPPVGAAVVVV